MDDEKLVESIFEDSFVIAMKISETYGDILFILMLVITCPNIILTAQSDPDCHGHWGIRLAHTHTYIINKYVVKLVPFLTNKNIRFI